MGPIGIGLIALGAGIAVLTGMSQGIGEANVAVKAIEMIGKNPEQYSKLRSTMIIGIALSETTGIYALVVAILIIFILPGKIA
jgi:F-type H+-transporting ATPase subunit c